jgi:hypothetical protein
MVVFRAVIRLRGGTAPAASPDVVRDVAQAASFDGEPFLRALRHSRGEASLKADEAKLVIGGYLRGMEALVSYLDRFHPQTS